MIGLVDSTKAEEFKVRNKAAKREHDKLHDHNHSSCADHTRKYFIAEADMSFVDKTINAKVTSAAFFKKNLVEMLTRAKEACTSIASKAK